MLAIFLDIETTGLDPLHHRAIDLAFKITDLKTGNCLEEYQVLIAPTANEWEMRDPVSMEVNGYSLEMLRQGKSVQEVKADILRIFARREIMRGKAVFICQNPAFDRSFFTQIIDVYTQEKLHWPYHWLDFASMYWATFAKSNAPLPEIINLSKNEIARLYQLPPEESPHRAINGVNHLIACYQKVIGFRDAQMNSHSQAFCEK